MVKRIASVIVVDDSIVQRHHAMLLLQDLGIEHVYEANSGVEALHVLSQLTKHPDLMVIDLEMPGMDGVQLLTELHHQYRDIPAIVLSSREEALLNSVSTMVKSTNMNVLAVIAKPFSTKKMLEAMQNYKKTSGEQSIVALPKAKPLFTEQEIIDAIEQHAVVAYYQPKLSIKTGALVGVEALARIYHADKGIMMPDQFIPVAERYDLIHGLTLDMFAQSVQQAKIWLEQGINIKVAVNLSAKSLEQPDFMKKLVDIQEQHNIAAEKMILEITESALVRDLGAALGILTSLRLKGFGLSIDDYGTGFSSMQQLSVIPFTELKIDRSFVSGAGQKKQLQVLLTSAIQMAKQLQLVTVAEGIETYEDWFLLQKMGCDIGQGFLMGKPMPIEAFPDWLVHHQENIASYKKSVQ